MDLRFDCSAEIIEDCLLTAVRIDVDVLDDAGDAGIGVGLGVERAEASCSCN